MGLANNGKGGGMYGGLRIVSVTVALVTCLCVSAVTPAQAGPVTYDFRTVPLLKDVGGNNASSIAPVLAEFQSMGFTLTPVGGLAFNVGCGTTLVDKCRGADQTSVNDFDGQIHGVFAVPSSMLGIIAVNSSTTVNPHGVGGDFIGSYGATSNYTGGPPVSHFEFLPNCDAMFVISWNPTASPVPEPASLLPVSAGIAGLGRAWRKRRQQHDPAAAETL